MESPKHINFKNNRLSIGRHRPSDSPKTPSSVTDGINLETPPSAKSRKRSKSHPDETKHSTPLSRKTTYINEESPSQEYEYFSQYSRFESPTQDIQCELRDVGWEWEEDAGEKRKKQNVENCNNQKKLKDIYGKNRRWVQARKAVLEKRAAKAEKGGFYIFQKEIETIKQSNGNTNNGDWNCSLKENDSFERAISNLVKEDAKNEITKSKNSENITLQKALSSRTNGNMQACTSTNCSHPERNITQKCQKDTRRVRVSIDSESPVRQNFFEDSDMDAMLIQASQSVEYNLDIENGVKTENVRTNFKAVEIGLSNFEGDSIDELLLSIPESELIPTSPSDKISCAQSAKTDGSKQGFTRHSSLPYSPQGTSKVSALPNEQKLFNRSNSMPLQKDGLATSSGVSRNLNSGVKRLCTKEEMERKRLEAKKRQLISQQKRMLHNQKNNGATSTLTSLANFSNFRTVRR